MKQDCQSKITNQLTLFKASIEAIPYDVVKYYFLLMYIAIHDELTHVKENKKKQDKILKIIFLAKKLTEGITSLLSEDHREHEKILNLMLEDLGILCKLASSNSYSTKFKQCFLNSVGLASGVVIGLCFGILGLFGGLISRPNIFKGAATGFFTGFLLGAFIGYRTPKKLSRSKYKRRTKFALNSINKSVNDILSIRNIRKAVTYHVENKILKTCFSNDKAKFHEFLSTNCEYEIRGSQAKFYSSTLKGYLGNHAWIRFKINGIKQVIELGCPTPYDNFANCVERRVVNGRMLISMLTEHEVLHKVKNLSSISGLVKFYKIGERDCNSYADQILTSTGQKPSTKIKRFMSDDKWVARRIFDKIFNWLAPFTKNDLVKAVENKALLETSVEDENAPFVRKTA